MSTYKKNFPGEDDDLWNRALAARLRVSRVPENIGRYSICFRNKRKWLHRPASKVMVQEETVLTREMSRKCEWG